MAITVVAVEGNIHWNLDTYLFVLKINELIVFQAANNSFFLKSGDLRGFTEKGNKIA